MKILLLFFMSLLTGCTWTFHRPPMKLNIPQTPPSQTTGSYEYYVIDEHSETPDAYFKTKKEAEEYKTYFKENHNYIIVQLQ
jgi:hypothetical protein